MKRSISVLLGCGIFAAVWVMPMAASVQGSFQRTFQVSGTVDLQVLTRSGDISVHPGPAGSVTIIGKIHVSDSWFEGNKQEQVAGLEKNPPIHQSGNSVRIDYVNVRNISIDYEITAPAETALTTHSGSGDQMIEGLRSNISLESGSGDMSLSNTSGQVTVHTGSGNIEARGLSGSLNADAGSGDIRLDTNTVNDAKIRTGSGNIEIRGVKGSLHAEAGSGDIRAEGSPTEGWEIRTGSGNVELRLAGDTGFDLEASTGSGELVVDQPVTMTIQGNLEHSQHRISGKVRNGGHRLVIHTGSGDVHIS